VEEEDVGEHEGGDASGTDGDSSEHEAEASGTDGGSSEGGVGSESEVVIEATRSLRP
jgi:hypothetical protein